MEAAATAAASVASDTAMKWSGAIFDSVPYSRLFLADPWSPSKRVPAEAIFDHSYAETQVAGELLKQLGVTRNSESRSFIRIYFVDWVYAHRYGGPSAHYVDHHAIVSNDLGKFGLVIGTDILRSGTLTVEGKGYVLELPLRPDG